MMRTLRCATIRTAPPASPQCLFIRPSIDDAPRATNPVSRPASQLADPPGRRHPGIGDTIVVMAPLMLRTACLRGFATLDNKGSKFYERIADELAAIRSAGLYKEEQVMCSPQSSQVMISQRQDTVDQRQ